MESQIYLKIIKKNGVLILICSIVIVLIIAFLTAKEGVKYDVSLSVSVSRARSSEYDGFYAGQASKLFTDTIASWLKAPEIVAEIYKEANLGLPAKGLRGLGNFFKLEGSASQHLKISFRENTKERAEKVAASLSQVIQKNGSELFSEKDRFNIMATKPLILNRKPLVLLNVAISFLVSIVVLFFIALVFEYFKENDGKENRD